jgi:hypothetical protein
MVSRSWTPSCPSDPPIGDAIPIGVAASPGRSRKERHGPKRRRRRASPRGSRFPGPEPHPNEAQLPRLRLSPFVKQLDEAQSGLPLGEDDTMSLATGVALGIAIGAGIGIALENVAVGIGIGVAIGIALGLAFQAKRTNQGPDNND